MQETRAPLGGRAHLREGSVLRPTHLHARRLILSVRRTARCCTAHPQEGCLWQRRSRKMAPDGAVGCLARSPTTLPPETPPCPLAARPRATRRFRAASPPVSGPHRTSRVCERRPARRALHRELRCPAGEGPSARPALLLAAPAQCTPLDTSPRGSRAHWWVSVPPVPPTSLVRTTAAFSWTKAVDAFALSFTYSVTPLTFSIVFSAPWRMLSRFAYMP